MHDLSDELAKMLGVNLNDLNNEAIGILPNASLEEPEVVNLPCGLEDAVTQDLRK